MIKPPKVLECQTWNHSDLWFVEKFKNINFDRKWQYFSNNFTQNEQIYEKTGTNISLSSLKASRVTIEEELEQNQFRPKLTNIFEKIIVQKTRAVYNILTKTVGLHR